MALEVCTVLYIICTDTQHTVCCFYDTHYLSFSFFFSLSLTNPPSARPISQIHNWPSIMPEFICMVPAEVFTRCLWVSLTWLGCRYTNLLGWSSGYSSIMSWIEETLWKSWFFFFLGAGGTWCLWYKTVDSNVRNVWKNHFWHLVVPVEFESR